MGLGPPRVTRTPRDTYPTELTPDTGLSHWWALPLVLPHTPRLGGDRLGCFEGRLGGLGVDVALLWRSRLALNLVDDRSRNRDSHKSNYNLKSSLSRGLLSLRFPPTVYLGKRLATKPRSDRKSVVLAETFARLSPQP